MGFDRTKTEVCVWFPSTVISFPMCACKHNMPQLQAIELFECTRRLHIEHPYLSGRCATLRVFVRNRLVQDVRYVTFLGSVHSVTQTITAAYAHGCMLSLVTLVTL